MSGFLNAMSFGTPLALWGLLSLPVIWWLLRFIPPKPKKQVFPPIRILLGLDPKQETPDKTPWWLLMLRLALAALLIFGVSHPDYVTGGSGTGYGGHSLVVLDNGWASAKEWNKRRDYLQGVLTEARNDDGVVTLVTSVKESGARQLQPVAAGDALNRAMALQPFALLPDRADLLAQLKSAAQTKPDRIIWLSDGQAAGTFASDLEAQYPGVPVTVVSPGVLDLPAALAPPQISGGDIKVDVLKPAGGVARSVTVQARAGNGRVLAEQSIDMPAESKTGTVTLALPTELRNEIQSIAIAGAEHAGARQLLDDRWRRKTVAVRSGEEQEDAQPLLSPLHYVERALEPYAEIYEPRTSADLAQLLDGGVSMLVLADIGVIPQQDAEKIAPWVEKGGLLLRFAGPRMAAAADDLLPVQLREGGRELGSALSWEEPQVLQAFPDKSPFAGLQVDQRATVKQQVLAEPDAELAERTWASLADGTPLVTANRRGKGLIVLFHATASPDWSDLPITGLFVEMLKRINDLAPSAGSAAAAGAVANAEAEAFVPRLILSGRGDLVAPYSEATAIPAAAFDGAKAAHATPPGLYARAGLERAVNLALTPDDVQPLATLPANAAQVTYAPPERMPLAPLAFLLAFAFFVADCVATILLGGGLSRMKQAAAPAALALALVFGGNPQPAAAQETDDFAMKAALETHLAYVRTGKPEIDDVSAAGLRGLGLIINDRTSVALADPFGIDIEKDEIVFFPLLYWPIDPDAEAPSDAAVSRIDAYMKNGGTIFFDLRDDGLGAESLREGSSAASEALKRILSKLDIPPLDVVADKHVLTRSFYLLEDFPGRYTGGPLWVEAGGSGSVSDPGTADGVSSIIIGSNDYAAAWALDDAGNSLYAVVPGEDRQREFAFRTGVNIVMYALTGNYKADQVHIPALLERLGQ